MWIALPPFVDLFMLPLGVFFAATSTSAAALFLVAATGSQWFDAR